MIGIVRVGVRDGGDVFPSGEVGGAVRRRRNIAVFVPENDLDLWMVQVCEVGANLAVCRAIVGQA